MDPTALLGGVGEHVAERGPHAQGAVAGDEPGAVEAAVAEIAQDGRPGVG
jgi:hypothetical protein